MFPLLSVDTTTRSSSVYLQSNQDTHLAKDDLSSQGVEGLLSLIHICLLEFNLEAKDLKTVCTSVGPGSFTGIRTGLAVSLGLGLGGSCAVLGVPLLAARIFAKSSGAGDYTGYMRASKIDYFAASYKLDETGQFFELEPASIKPEAQIAANSSNWLNLDVLEGSGAEQLARCAQIEGNFGLERLESSELNAFTPKYVKPVNAKTLKERGI